MRNYEIFQLGLAYLALPIFFFAMSIWHMLKYLSHRKTKQIKGGAKYLRRCKQFFWIPVNEIERNHIIQGQFWLLIFAGYILMAIAFF